jgi:hypothetical protein
VSGKGFGLIVAASRFLVESEALDRFITQGPWDDALEEKEEQPWPDKGDADGMRVAGQRREALLLRRL